MLKFVQDFVGYAVPKSSFMDLVSVQVKKEFWIFFVCGSLIVDSVYLV